MAPKLQHIRSTVPHKRPDPALLVDGQAAQNQALESPGMFIKDAAGGLIKVGPTHVGPTAPNSTPAGVAGNSVGEQWVDTAGPKPILKTWDGAQWLASGGGATVETGDIAPATPIKGDLWFRTDVGQLYVWYEDGTSGQWVEANTSPAGADGQEGPQGPKGERGDVGPVGPAGPSVVINAGAGLTGGVISTTGSVALDTAFTDDRYVNLTGDTMTGPLVVPDATLGTQAVNLATADARYVNLTGDTMNGNLTVPSLNGGPLAGFRNVLINGDLRINQRKVTIAAAPNGTYGPDRWKKVDASNMTQVVESGNFVPGAVYTLSGTGVTTRQVTAPASGNWTLPNIPITATNIQLEQGSVATPFERRGNGVELALCRRYYQLLTYYGGSYSGASCCYFAPDGINEMRSAPTITTSVYGFQFYNGTNWVGQSTGAVFTVYTSPSGTWAIQVDGLAGNATTIPTPTSVGCIGTLTSEL
jgi:hypothetical protein